MSIGNDPEVDNYLGVRLNLLTNKIHEFLKSNENLTYITTLSNHLKSDKGVLIEKICKMSSMLSLDTLDYNISIKNKNMTPN